MTCLQFNRKFAITSSDDGTVKIWSVKTGEFLRDLVKLESGGSGGVVWRIRCSNTKLVCAVGSRNGTEETKLLVLDFDVSEDNHSSASSSSSSSAAKVAALEEGSSDSATASTSAADDQVSTNSATRRLSMGGGSS